MYIAYVLTEDIPFKGTTGASAHVRNVVEQLEERDHTLQLVSCVSRTGEETQSSSVSTNSLRLVLSALTPETIKRTVKDWTMRRQNRRFVQEHQDSLKKSDVIYERDAYQSFGTQAVAAETDTPWIIECNGLFWDEQTPFSNPVWPDWYRKKHVQKWAEADHLIVVSQSFKEHVVQEGIDPEKITVIHNGVDLEPHRNVSQGDVEAFRTKWGVEEEKTIGFLGHMLPWHRIDLLVDAIKHLRASGYDVKGLCVGGGRWKKYEQYAREKEVEEEVVFTGPVPPSEVPTAVAAMDVCTAPGIYEPGSPVKLFDYGASGGAVVAANSPSVTEIITDEETGLLFEDGPLEGFTAALKRLLDAENLREQFGKQLREKVEREHTWRHVGQRTEEVIREVTDR